MKKGAFESKQTLLLFEVVFSLLVIAAFYAVAQGEGEVSYGTLDATLTATALVHGEYFVENPQLVQQTIPLQKVRGVG